MGSALLCSVAQAQTPGDYADYLRSYSEDPLDVSQDTSPISDRISNDAVEYEGGSCGSCDDCSSGGSGSLCDSCCGSCEDPKLFGLFARSDREFSRFISPISNPFFFEDPRALTEARGHFVNQVIPSSSGLGKGDMQLYAVQLRAAVTDRLSIIATKDGYITQQFDNLPNDEGVADVAAGFKYAFLRDSRNQRIATAGMTFEADLGDKRVFQGTGDGEFHFFLSGGFEFLERGHWLSGTGFRIPTDHTQRSQMWWWSNHWDYEFIDNLYGLIELNWFHWMRSGERLAVNFEGGDLLNLGSTNVAGNDIVTMAVGGRARLTEGVTVGAGWEYPLTNRRDMLHDRAYADLIFRY